MADRSAGLMATIMLNMTADAPAVARRARKVCRMAWWEGNLAGLALAAAVAALIVGVAAPAHSSAVNLVWPLVAVGLGLLAASTLIGRRLRR